MSAASKFVSCIDIGSAIGISQYRLIKVIDKMVQCSNDIANLMDFVIFTLIIKHDLLMSDCNYYIFQFHQHMSTI